MKTNFIFSFEDGQEFLDLDLLPLKSKQVMIAFCLGLTMGMFPNRKLVKISMCVYTMGRETVRLPEWYEKCGGKLWEDDLKL